MSKIAGILLLACTGLSVYAGDLPRFGQELTAEELSFWDRSIAPDGKNLPDGKGTALQGKAIYRQKCIACHGPDGVIARPEVRLKGGRGSLTTDKPLRTVGSYWPFATTVFDYIRRAMPYTAQKSLDDDQVYALTAYLLYINDIIDEETVIDRHSLPSVKMPNRDGFISFENQY